jgi:hypothetical protein
MRKVVTQEQPNETVLMKNSIPFHYMLFWLEWGVKKALKMGNEDDTIATTVVPWQNSRH